MIVDNDNRISLDWQSQMWLVRPFVDWIVDCRRLLRWSSSPVSCRLRCWFMCKVARFPLISSFLGGRLRKESLCLAISYWIVLIFFELTQSHTPCEFNDCRDGNANYAYCHQLCCHSWFCLHTVIFRCTFADLASAADSNNYVTCSIWFMSTGIFHFWYWRLNY